MFTVDDYSYMSRALQCAENGLFSTDPNPRVGCVLVKNNNIIAEGWHEIPGEAHAEINAIENAGSDAQKSVAYITLEPCCHHGKTPPCTDALIKNKIKKVFVAMQDPNPSVDGKGLRALQDAGIEVENGLLQEQAMRLNPGYIMRFSRKRPLIRIKMAMSLDGKTALENGESHWISGEQARKDVQRLRARSSAVLTGIDTVLQDNPGLDVRLNSCANRQGVIRQPLRIVLDSHLRIQADMKLFHKPGDLLIITSVADTSVIAEKTQAFKAVKQNCDIVTIPSGKFNRPDLHNLVSYLADSGINELLIESGSKLAGSFIEHGLVDELVCYIAPHILGHTAKSLFTLPALTSMQSRFNLDIKEVRKIGRDLKLIAVPV